MSEQDEVIPKGGFKVKIKDGNSCFYLTAGAVDLGAVSDSSGASTFAVAYDDTDKSLTIKLDDGRGAGITGGLEFAPVSDSANYTWTYAARSGDEYTQAGISLRNQTRYWSVVTRDGVHYVTPETDSSKAWTLEVEEV